MTPPAPLEVEVLVKDFARQGYSRRKLRRVESRTEAIEINKTNNNIDIYNTNIQQEEINRNMLLTREERNLIRGMRSKNIPYMCPGDSKTCNLHKNMPFTDEIIIVHLQNANFKLYDFNKQQRSLPSKHILSPANTNAKKDNIIPPKKAVAAAAASANDLPAIDDEIKFISPPKRPRITSNQVKSQNPGDIAANIVADCIGNNRPVQTQGKSLNALINAGKIDYSCLVPLTNYFSTKKQ